MNYALHSNIHQDRKKCSCEGTLLRDYLFHYARMLAYNKQAMQPPCWSFNASISWHVSICPLLPQLDYVYMRSLNIPNNSTGLNHPLLHAFSLYCFSFSLTKFPSLMGICKDISFCPVHRASGSHLLLRLT